LNLKDIPTMVDLKRIRRSSGITQKELAQKAGVSQSLIARIEGGNIDPRLSTVQKIMRALVILGETNTAKDNVIKTAKDIMHSPVITVNSKDKIRKVVELMHQNNISQMPVIQDRRIIGSIQETTIVQKLLQSKEPETIFSEYLEKIMETGFSTVNPSTELENILTLLSKNNSAVLVVDVGKVVGIITKIDVILNLTHSTKDE
jgi:predicted transcriptional regulator